MSHDPYDDDYDDEEDDVPARPPPSDFDFDRDYRNPIKQHERGAADYRRGVYKGRYGFWDSANTYNCTQELMQSDRPTQERVTKDLEVADELMTATLQYEQGWLDAEAAATGNTPRVASAGSTAPQDYRRLLPVPDRPPPPPAQISPPSSNETTKRVPWHPSLEQRCETLNIEARIAKLRSDDNNADKKIVREIAKLRLPKEDARLLVRKIASQVGASSPQPYLSEYAQLTLEYEPAERYEEVYEDHHLDGDDDDGDNDYSTDGIPDDFDFEIFTEAKHARVQGIVSKGRQYTITDICGFLRVLARAVDENGDLCGYEIEHLDHTGQKRRRVVSERQLAGEGTTLFQELGEAGLWINGDVDARNAFRKLIREWSINRTITIYSRPGWHCDWTAFVCPTGEIIRPDDAPNTDARLASDVLVKDRRPGGSLEAWKAGVGFQIWNGDTPQFAIGLLAGVTGPLLPLPDVDSFGLYFYGPTECGKTTAQIIAAGTVANPEPRQGVLITLDDVDDKNGLQAWFRTAYGAGPHIDDTKTGKDRKVEAILHQASDGTWQSVWSVSSEMTLREVIGSSLRTGAVVRLIPVNVKDVPRIDTLRAAAIKRAARDNYGWVLREIVREILYQRKLDEAAFQQYTASFATKLPGHDGAGSYRASRSFGAMWAAGELLQTSKLIPDYADVGAVIHWAWEGWQREMAGVSGAGTPVEKALRALREWIGRHGDSRLHPLKGEGTDPAWGWLGDDGKVYIRADKIADAAGGRVGRAELVDALRDNGMLILPTNPTKNRAWMRVPGHGQLTNYRLKPLA